MRRISSPPCTTTCHAHLSACPPSQVDPIVTLSTCQIPYQRLPSYHTYQTSSGCSFPTNHADHFNSTLPNSPVIPRQISFFTLSTPSVSRANHFIHPSNSAVNPKRRIPDHYCQTPTRTMIRMTSTIYKRTLHRRMLERQPIQ